MKTNDEGDRRIPPRPTVAFIVSLPGFGRRIA
ncbi:hypothetical protein Mlaev_01167 [Microbacterium laevaniformans]|uniref:Uncharacterized protein n=1 Tax=Microbacterium laevaniformans TaxID=36807 RepID=A0A150HFL8_9MICO|nr:hypothetical protein Mlaev_01167 [Microbacterium laevaniformans]